jgi:hypothetical protein
MKNAEIKNDFYTAGIEKLFINAPNKERTAIQIRFNPFQNQPLHSLLF